MKKGIIISAVNKFAVYSLQLAISFLANCLLPTSSSKAQPNGGFENWSTVFNYQKPDDWQTLNFLSVLTPTNPLSAFKATGIDKHSGNYALKLKTIFVNNNPSPSVIDDTIGGVFTGRINISPPSYKYGFPYTGRPEKLEFWAKYAPVGIDTGGARVFMQKWNGTSTDTIALGETIINATEAYTLFQINLIYYSTALPDTVTIVFGSSKGINQARVGSTIYIDDVVFTGWVGVDEKDLFFDKVKIFPNPATDEVNILAQIDEANKVKVLDATGKLAGVYTIRNYNATINTSLFARGVYFYEISDKKDKILTKGKFSVVR